MQISIRLLSISIFLPFKYLIYFLYQRLSSFICIIQNYKPKKIIKRENLFCYKYQRNIKFRIEIRFHLLIIIVSYSKLSKYHFCLKINEYQNNIDLITQKRYSLKKEQLI